MHMKCSFLTVTICMQCKLSGNFYVQWTVFLLWFTFILLRLHTFSNFHFQICKFHATYCHSIWFTTLRIIPRGNTEKEEKEKEETWTHTKQKCLINSFLFLVLLFYDVSNIQVLKRQLPQCKRQCIITSVTFKPHVYSFLFFCSRVSILYVWYLFFALELLFNEMYTLTEEEKKRSRREQEQKSKGM